VEVLSKFFASVYTVISDDVLPVLQKKSISHKMDQITISNESVSKLLHDLKLSKSAGPDDIHPCVLKELASQLSTPLTLIFRSSLSTGKLPCSWKSANITAVYKKGDRKDPSNYRPVSLTSVVCKILEKLFMITLSTITRRMN